MLFASGAAMVMPSRRVRSGRAASTSATSCSSRTSTSGGDCGCSATGCATCPQSVVFHRHHASMARFGAWREHYLLERNALFTIYKNYDDENLRAGAAGRARAGGAARRRARRRRRRTRSISSGRERRRARRPDSRAQVDARRPLYAVDALRRGDRRASPRLARELQRGAATRRPGDPAAVPAAAAPQHRRLRASATGFAAVVDALRTSRSVFADAAPDPRRHRRLARAARWPAPRSAPGRSRCALSPRARRGARVARSSAEDSDASRLPGAQGRPATSSTELVSWCDVVDLPGLHHARVPGDRDVEQGHRRRHLRPVPPRAARAGARPGRGRPPQDIVRGRDRRAQPAAHARRLLPLRERQAARLLARPARRGRPHQPGRPTTPARAWTSSSRSSPFGVSATTRRGTPRPVLKGVVPGIGAGRQGHPLGRRHLQLVRPAHAAPRGRQAAGAPARACGCSSSGCKHPNPNVPEMRMAVRDAPRSPTSSASPTRHVFFNEGWVAYDDRQNYLLECRHRREHAPRPRRDRVLVPHPHPRLPVGRRCPSSRPAATRSPT